MLRIALVDSHELVRIGLKTVLAHAEGIEVVADIDNHATIQPMVAQLGPELVLVDAQDPAALNSLDALQQTHPQVRVALMTATFSLDCLLHTLCGNSCGYLLKSAAPAELVVAVKAMAAEGIYIHSKLMEGLPANLLKRHAARECPRQLPKPTALSEREQEIVSLLVRGYTNREISQQMYFSTKTVEAYRARIYNKLGVRTRAHLVSFAIDHGMLSFVESAVAPVAS